MPLELKPCTKLTYHFEQKSPLDCWEIVDMKDKLNLTTLSLNVVLYHNYANNLL